MKIYEGFEDRRLKARPRSVAIGVFDGVHLGHQKILRDLFRRAKRLGARPTIVTFDPHPEKVLRPGNANPILMSLPHRLRLFGELGVAETVVVRFNKRFAAVTHQRFLEELLVGRLGMRSLSVGRDFRFGRGGRGDIGYLAALSCALGYEFTAVPPFRLGGHVVSSTRIRKLIRSGRLKDASRMLGRSVSVYGTVVRGRGRGKSVGFPTANLNPHHETLPPPGVYAAWGILDGRRLQAVLNLGSRPTFGDRETALEAHFLRFHGDLYGREIELDFVKKLRSVRRFAGREELARAIRADIRRAERVLGLH
ncbi:MAG TPA: bifunctional riboflavin kinase/FAD synthetase [Candidatus Eisenbacteria bacterium]|nr:bifunctional riboflavin kinase/FAD synthetase [Candidatus Eisenbacteria bacterium]